LKTPNSQSGNAFGSFESAKPFEFNVFPLHARMCLHFLAITWNHCLLFGVIPLGNIQLPSSWEGHFVIFIGPT
jgi:hypothetical protein